MKLPSFPCVLLRSIVILTVKNFHSILPKSVLLQFKLFTPITIHSSSGEQTISFCILAGFDGLEDCCHVPLFISSLG